MPSSFDFILTGKVFMLFKTLEVKEVLGFGN